MYIGFINVHPITLPLGNEIAHSISVLYHHLVIMYTLSIKPDIIKLIEVADML